MASASPGDSTWLPSPPAAPAAPGGFRRTGAIVAGVALLVIVAAVAVVAVVFRPKVVRVPSASMEPTIRSGEYVLISRNVAAIARGDIVVFRDPSEPTRSRIYRVIVLPGERFQIRGGVVSVNGKALDEPYVAPENRDDQDHGPYQMPANQYWLMGDNRRDAADSRYIGVIERNLIWGKLVRQ